MGRRRGFFAELQYQNQLAAKQREQAERAAAREYARRVREAEQAQRRAERAAAQAQRASMAEQKAAEKEASVCTSRLARRKSKPSTHGLPRPRPS